MQYFISNTYTQRHTCCTCSSLRVHKAKQAETPGPSPCAAEPAFRKLWGRPNTGSLWEGLERWETLDTLLKLLLTHPRFWPGSAGVYTLWSRFLKASVSLSSIICPTQTQPGHVETRKDFTSFFRDSVTKLTAAIPGSTGHPLPQKQQNHLPRPTEHSNQVFKNLRWNNAFSKTPGSDWWWRVQATHTPPHFTAWFLRAQLTHLPLYSGSSWGSHCGSGFPWSSAQKPHRGERRLLTAQPGRKVVGSAAARLGCAICPCSNSIAVIVLGVCSAWYPDGKGWGVLTLWIRSRVKASLL